MYVRKQNATGRKRLAVKDNINQIKDNITETLLRAKSLYIISTFLQC